MKIFGNFDFIGNPINLIEAIGSGIIDLLYDPFKELWKKRNLTKFGKKFGQNLVNFIKTILNALYLFIKKISATAFKILASFTFDKEY